MISSRRGDLVKSRFRHVNLSCLANYLQLLVGRVRIQRGYAGKLLQTMPLSEQYAIQYQRAVGLWAVVLSLAYLVWRA